MTKETKDLGAAPPRYLTDSEIATIERLLSEVSPLPWKVCGASEGKCACGLLWSVPLDDTVARFYEETDDHKIGRAAMVANVTLCATLVNAAPSLISDSRALLEARRLLEEAYIFTDALAKGDLWNFDVTKLRDKLRAFLRSDSERSEHGKG